MVGEFFGGLFGGASAIASQQLAYHNQKKLMDKQYTLNKKAMKNYYSWHRQSLEKADFNPLLNVPGSTAQGFSANASSPTVDVGAGIQSGVESAIAIKKAIADVDNSKADTDVKKYGKTGAILKNLLNINKDKNAPPEFKKVVNGLVKNVEFSANSSPELTSWEGYKNWFYKNHPNTYKLFSNLKHKDFEGARTAVKNIYQNRRAKLNSAKSVQFRGNPRNPYLDNEIHSDKGYDFQYINDIDKYDDWNKKHGKYKKYDYDDRPSGKGF